MLCNVVPTKVHKSSYSDLLCERIKAGRHNIHKKILKKANDIELFFRWVEIVFCASLPQPRILGNPNPWVFNCNLRTLCGTIKHNLGTFRFDSGIILQGIVMFRCWIPPHQKSMPPAHLPVAIKRKSSITQALYIHTTTLDSTI